jgi:DNA-binding NtrC family response regulator
MAGSALDTAKVHPLRPPRVVVAVADRRFARLASFLLGRRGFEVHTTKRPRELLELLDRRAADAVILDGTGSFTETARLAGAVEALHPETTVIVVAEDAHAVEPLQNLQLFPKWSGFDALAQSIERAHLGGLAS